MIFINTNCIVFAAYKLTSCHRAFGFDLNSGELNKPYYRLKSLAEEFGHLYFGNNRSNFNNSIQSFKPTNKKTLSISVIYSPLSPPSLTHKCVEK